MPGQGRNYHVLAIVDDDASMRSALQALLGSAGLHARGFASAGEFLASGQVSETTLLITDVNMPTMTGIELQAHLLAEGFRMPIIFITAYSSPRIRAQVMQAGAVDMLVKPFTDQEFLTAIHAALGV